MRTSEALWKVFITTGHIGAYLLYKEYAEQESVLGKTMKGTDLNQFTSCKAE